MGLAGYTLLSKLRSCTNRILQVHNLEIWHVPQVINLRPENRYAASDLNEAHPRDIIVAPFTRNTPSVNSHL
jgi:hypothetical protein